MLLDTCTFLWAAQEVGRLSRTARETLEDPDHDVYLSAVSAWEIALNYAAGKLPLPEAPARYIPEVRERHGFDRLPLDEEAALHLARLPALHRDPFDRMLVSQALVGGMVLLTPDRLISQYPLRSLW